MLIRFDSDPIGDSVSSNAQKRAVKLDKKQAQWDDKKKKVS
jgi:hypothetical protein